MSGRGGVFALVAVLAGSVPVEARPANPAPVVALPDTALRTIVLPPALPGAVLTATVDVPLDVRGPGAARWVVLPAPRVRLFGPQQGVFAAGHVPSLIPLTFVLSRDQVAGPLVVATVTLTWDDGRLYTAELQLDVQPARHVRLSLSAAGTATPSRALVVHYRVANLGNAPDTVALSVRLAPGWRSTAPRTPFAVSLRDSAEGSFSVRLPRDAVEQEYSLEVLAAGLADTSFANVHFRVGRDNRTSSWASIPGTLFVGVPSIRSGASDPEVSLMARGRPEPGTELSLTLRHAAETVRPTAFYQYGAGPEFLATIERTDVRLSAGDVYAPLGGIFGSYGFGTGGHVTWRRSTLGELYLARPRDYGSAPLDGILARGRFGLVSAAGDFSVNLTDLERPLRQGLPLDRDRGATLAFESHRQSGHAGQELKLEAGIQQLTTGSLSRSGPALEGSYALHQGAGFAFAHARLVPGVLPGNSGGNEAYLGGGFPVLGPLSVLGWGSATSVAQLGQQTTSTADGVFGLRLGGGQTSLQLRGRYSHAATPTLVTGGSWDEYAGEASASLGVHGITLQANGDDGVIRVVGGGTLPLRDADLNASWRGNVGGVYLGTSYSEGRFGEQPLRIDGGGALSSHGFQLAGGLGAFLSRFNGTYLGSGWGAVTVPLPLSAAAILGADYLPWMPTGSRVRFSAGLRMGLAVPILIPRRAAVSGRVFEDLNLDGIRQSGEPLLPGVGLHLGSEMTSTDSYGRYAFPRQPGAHARLQVEGASLPIGWLVESYAANARRVNVPVVRAGALTIRLLAEDVRVGPDSTRLPVPDVWIELVSKDGRERNATSDSTGTIHFGALPPGQYTLTVHPVGARGQELKAIVVEVEVPYGKARDVVVVVPTLPLRVRFMMPPQSLPPGQLGPPILKSLHKD